MMIINLVNRQVVIVTNVIRQIYAGNPHTSAALTFCTWTKSSAAQQGEKASQVSGEFRGSEKRGIFSNFLFLTF